MKPPICLSMLPHALPPLLHTALQPGSKLPISETTVFFSLSLWARFVGVGSFKKASKPEDCGEWTLAVQAGARSRRAHSAGHATPGSRRRAPRLLLLRRSARLRRGATRLHAPSLSGADRQLGAGGGGGERGDTCGREGGLRAAAAPGCAPVALPLPGALTPLLPRGRGRPRTGAPSKRKNGSAHAPARRGAGCGVAAPGGSVRPWSDGRRLGGDVGRGALRVAAKGAWRVAMGTVAPPASAGSGEKPRFRPMIPQARAAREVRCCSVPPGRAARPARGALCMRVSAPLTAPAAAEPLHLPGAEPGARGRGRGRRHLPRETQAGG